MRFERKSNRNLTLIQQYDVKMTSNYVIVSIKFIYLDVGHDIVVCNFNNGNIMSQPTAPPDHFSLTGHLQLIPLELIYSHVQGQGAILGGVVPLGSPNLDPISDEKMFHTRFWTLASKFHTRFQTWRWSQTQHTYLTEIISSLLRLERQQKDVFLS